MNKVTRIGIDICLTVGIALSILMGINNQKVMNEALLYEFKTRILIEEVAQPPAASIINPLDQGLIPEKNTLRFY